MGIDEVLIYAIYLCTLDNIQSQRNSTIFVNHTTISIINRTYTNKTSQCKKCICQPSAFSSMDFPKSKLHIRKVSCYEKMTSCCNKIKKKCTNVTSGLPCKKTLLLLCSATILQYICQTHGWMPEGHIMRFCHFELHSLLFARQSAFNGIERDSATHNFLFSGK